MLTTAMQKLWYLAIALAIGLLCSLAALADRPVKPPRVPTREFVSLYPGLSTAWDINDAGLIVGHVMQDSIPVAGYWNASDATPTFTPLVAGYYAIAVNENGAVVASADVGPALYYAHSNIMFSSFGKSLVTQHFCLEHYT